MFPGYDTVRLWLPYSGDTRPGAGYWEKAQRLGCRIGHDKKGRQLATLPLGNIQAAFMAGGLSVRGSLARYAHGDNLSGILPGDVPDVLAKLSERLEADLMHAKATRIDAALSVEVRNPVREYLEMLGSMPRKAKSTLGDTVYYQTKKRGKVLAFYDKGAEMQAKGKTQPGHWLRYELRLSKPGESLGGAVTGADLAEGWPLERMAAMMWKEYKSITKQDTMKAPTGIRTAGEGKAYCHGVIMRAALQSGVVGDLVERVRNNNPGMASKELYRLRKALEKEAAGYGADSELANELDGIFSQALGVEVPG